MGRRLYERGSNRSLYFARAGGDKEDAFEDGDADFRVVSIKTIDGLQLYSEPRAI
jgi:hypothetical protein